MPKPPEFVVRELLTRSDLQRALENITLRLPLHFGAIVGVGTVLVMIAVALINLT
jgi:hypothetical protein